MCEWYFCIDSFDTERELYVSPLCWYPTTVLELTLRKAHVCEEHFIAENVQGRRCHWGLCEYESRSARRELLENHFVTHHINGRRQYECGHCDKKFRRSCLFLDHTLYDHPAGTRPINVGLKAL
jgi:hypothetical protein